MNDMSKRDTERLRQAKRVLENPSFFITLADKAGKPLDWAVKKLPGGAQKKVHQATRKALEKALDVAVYSLGKARSDSIDPASSAKVKGRSMYKAVLALTGAVGGAGGILALAVELPISTTFMLRSIADIARQYGEDIRKTESRLQCLTVFALGGKSCSDDAAETTYFGTRVALQRSLVKAAEFIAERGLTEEGAPVLLRFIMAVAARFEIEVTEKAIAQALPAIGAIGGAGINMAFISHFQKMADGHFCVRFLERKYGKQLVKRTYINLQM